MPAQLKNSHAFGECQVVVRSLSWAVPYILFTAE